MCPCKGGYGRSSVVPAGILIPADVSIITLEPSNEINELSTKFPHASNKIKRPIPFKISAKEILFAFNTPLISTSPLNEASPSTVK